MRAAELIVAVSLAVDIGVAQPLETGLAVCLAVLLSRGRGVTVGGPGAAWRLLPWLPAGQAVVLALPDPESPTCSPRPAAC